MPVCYASGETMSKHDPYYFSPALGELDLHLIGEGKHHQIYRKLGAHPTVRDGVSGTHFAVWAPNAERVSVVGDFNLWDGRRHPMHLHPSVGVWELFLPGVGLGTAYKYEVRSAAGEIALKADPYGFAMQLRPQNSSIVADIDTHQWADSEWMAARTNYQPLGAPISIYEVHPGSWKRVVNDGGDRFFTYDELVKELVPYVREMGYTHVELIGIAEHPLDASWGYQVIGHFAPTARFGDAAGFKRLVDAFHAHNIGVILDWVPGHFPKDAHGLSRFDGTCLYEHEDPRLGEHREWDTRIFNYARHEVRNFLIANALFWLAEYHIDGLRVDAVASMLHLDYGRDDGQWLANRYGGRENLEAIEFLRELNSTIEHLHPGVLRIAEESTQFPGVTRAVEHGGLGFTFKWNMGWMNDTLKYVELDPIHRQHHGQLISFAMMYAYSEHFLLPLSHDEFVHGKKALLSKPPGDPWQQAATLRAYLGWQLAHPGKQLLFMGCELGQRNEWYEAVSLDWHLLQDPAHAGIQTWVRAMNHFYRDHPGMYEGDGDGEGFAWLQVNDDAHSVYVVLRRRSASDGQPLLCAFNFTPVPRPGYRVSVPYAGLWSKLLDSDSPEYGGSNFSPMSEAVAVQKEGEPGGAGVQLQIDLPPLSMVVYQAQPGGNETKKNKPPRRRKSQTKPTR